LSIEPSSYDLCLMISTNKEAFGVVVMQTDDTLGLSDKAFVVFKDEQLEKAKLIAKPKEFLSKSNAL
jgi:hypothetical protein